MISCCHVVTGYAACRLVINIQVDLNLAALNNNCYNVIIIMSGFMQDIKLYYFGWVGKRFWHTHFIFLSVADPTWNNSRGGGGGGLMLGRGSRGAPRSYIQPFGACSIGRVHFNVSYVM